METCRGESRSETLLMRIAQMTGNVKWSRRSLILLVISLLMVPFGPLQAEEPAAAGEVSAVSVETADGSVIIDLAIDRPTGVRSFNLTAPDRLVFDIENAVLKLGSEASTEWLAPYPGVD